MMDKLKKSIAASTVYQYMRQGPKPRRAPLNLVNSLVLVLGILIIVGGMKFLTTNELGTVGQAIKSDDIWVPLKDNCYCNTYGAYMQYSVACRQANGADGLTNTCKIMNKCDNHNQIISKDPRDCKNNKCEMKRTDCSTIPLTCSGDLTKVMRGTCVDVGRPPSWNSGAARYLCRNTEEQNPSCGGPKCDNNVATYYGCITPWGKDAKCKEGDEIKKVDCSKNKCKKSDPSIMLTRGICDLSKDGGCTYTETTQPGKQCCEFGEGASKTARLCDTCGEFGCMSMAVPTEKCGNGRCDPQEDSITCPSDCTCGDGICSLGEEPNDCPADCELENNKEACMDKQDNDGDKQIDCRDPECRQDLNRDYCADDCTTCLSQHCLYQCQGAGDIFKQPCSTTNALRATCGKCAGKFCAHSTSKSGGIYSGCVDAWFPERSCGDGKCESICGETYLTCSRDCSRGTGSGPGDDQSCTLSASICAGKGCSGFQPRAYRINRWIACHCINCKKIDDDKDPGPKDDKDNEGDHGNNGGGGGGGCPADQVRCPNECCLKKLCDFPNSIAATCRTCESGQEKCGDTECCNPENCHPDISAKSVCCQPGQAPCGDTACCNPKDCTPDFLGNPQCTIGSTGICTAPEECDDQDPCTENQCVNDQCEYPPSNKLGCCPTGQGPCGDTLCCYPTDCTLDFLGNPICGRPVPEPCTAPEECDDQDICTEDSCLKNQCQHTPSADPTCLAKDDDDGTGGKCCTIVDTNCNKKIELTELAKFYGEILKRITQPFTRLNEIVTKSWITGKCAIKLEGEI